MKKSDFFEFMLKIPKAELHLHVEGTVHPDSVRRMLARNPETASQNIDVKSLFSATNLTDFINSFLYVQGLFRTPADLEAMLDDVNTYLRDNNIVYTEVFFSPSLFLKKGFNFPEMVSTLHRCFEKMQADGKLKIKLIVDVGRTFGAESAQNNLDDVIKLLNPDIIGIGLGGDERRGPAKEFGAVFKQARKKGLRVVAHAGEDVGPESIWDAINLLGAERIGHGLAAIDDPKLRQLLKDKKIPIEICISSNANLAKGYVSSIDKHPVRTFFDEGLLTVINTDDPTFFNASLIGEYWLLHTKLKFTMAEIKTLVINGFEASFLDAKEKASYIAQVEAAWASAKL